MKFFENISNSLKKVALTISLAVGISFVADAQWVYPGGLTTVSQTVLVGTMTNLVTGPFRLTEIVLNSTNSGLATVTLVDATTNLMVYTTSAYSNVVMVLTNAATYATNGGSTAYNQFIYTNYFGVITTNYAGTGTPQQFVIIEQTNSVAAATTALPSVTVSATSTPLVINNLSQVFYRGIWVTNSSPTNAVITLVGTRFQ